MGESWEQYLRRMRKRKEWGGHIELMGAANLLGVGICVITDQPGEGCDVWVQPHATVSDDIILLGFDSVSHHYYSLEGMFASCYLSWITASYFFCMETVFDTTNIFSF